MREIRKSGSEGGAAQANESSLPLCLQLFPTLIICPVRCPLDSPSNDTEERRNRTIDCGMRLTSNSAAIHFGKTVSFSRQVHGPGMPTRMSLRQVCATVIPNVPMGSSAGRLTGTLTIPS